MKWQWPISENCDRSSKALSTVPFLHRGCPSSCTKEQAESKHRWLQGLWRRPVDSEKGRWILATLRPSLWGSAWPRNHSQKMSSVYTSTASSSSWINGRPASINEKIKDNSFSIIGSIHCTMDYWIRHVRTISERKNGMNGMNRIYEMNGMKRMNRIE